MTPIETACECVDAAVFSGAHMDDPAERQMLREYIERWENYLKPYDAIETAGLSTEKASELIVAPMVEALQHAIEGECDGLAISEAQAVSILGYVAAHASPADAARIGAAAPVLAIDVTDVDGVKSIEIDPAKHPIQFRMMAAAALRTLSTADHPREDLDLDAVRSMSRYIAGDTTVPDPVAAPPYVHSPDPALFAITVARGDVGGFGFLVSPDVIGHQAFAAEAGALVTKLASSILNIEITKG